MTIETLKSKTLPIFSRRRITRAAVFGSVARGEDNEASDVDVLVELKRPYGLASFVALKRDLEAALNKRVDIVEYDAIKPDFKKNILKDAAVIYEQR